MALLLRIREVSGSYLSPEIGYLNRFFVAFPQSLQASFRTIATINVVTTGVNKIMDFRIRELLIKFTIAKPKFR
jgi:hypothetical protein